MRCLVLTLSMAHIGFQYFYKMLGIQSAWHIWDFSISMRCLVLTLSMAHMVFQYFYEMLGIDAQHGTHGISVFQ